MRSQYAALKASRNKLEAIFPSTFKTETCSLKQHRHSQPASNVTPITKQGWSNPPLWSKFHSTGKFTSRPPSALTDSRIHLNYISNQTPTFPDMYHWPHFTKRNNPNSAKPNTTKFCIAKAPEQRISKEKNDFNITKNQQEHCKYIGNLEPHKTWTALFAHNSK